MTTWQPSRQVGPYVLIEPLGAGGMGEVWKARDERVGRTVALKRLKPEHAQRFKQEARAIAALNHPHICQLYDIGDDYLVMEYVEGTPLQCPQPQERAIRLALQIADALGEAHSKGIVHRDLKPDNVLVNEKGAAKLLDFGLACFSAADLPDDATMTAAGTVNGQIAGTVAYMSPEQAQGLMVDARSDVFSFGLVLYELLSGSRAFRGETAVATLSSILKDDPPPLAAAPSFEPVIRRCLAKNPAARYQSIADVRAALQHAASPVEAQPSIAVLPFVNMSGDPEQEYFSDGLAEEIINALVRVPGLKVIARTSAFAFKGQNVDIRKIAEALGVNHVLEGSVRKAGSRIRVTAQLIAARDGSHLWSERYDRELADVFAIQDEIAQSISRELRLKLSSAPSRRQPPLAAYEALLRGRHYYQQWTPDAQKLGEACYREAIALDPGYTQPYCELGANYFSAVTETQLAPADAAQIMKSLAGRSLSADPADPEAHILLALVAVLEYAWEQAGREFQVALDAGYVTPLSRQAYVGWYLLPIGNLPEASRQLDLALQEDPLNPLLRLLRAEMLLAAGDPSGERECLNLLALHPDFWIPMGWLAAHYAADGRLDAALPWLERCHRLVPDQPGIAGELSAVLSRLGKTDDATRVQAMAAAADPHRRAVFDFSVHMVNADLASAAQSLNTCITRRDTRAPWILPNLFGPAFTHSAHWPPLARKMGLPPGAWAR
jgi:TolB-like protein/predicted Ser/Thr protein kinase